VVIVTHVAKPAARICGRIRSGRRAMALRLTATAPGFSEFNVSPAAAAGERRRSAAEARIRALYLYIGPSTMWERFWLRWVARTRPAEPGAVATESEKK
jgi:hypothetical protein